MDTEKKTNLDSGRGCRVFDDQGRKRGGVTDFLFFEDWEMSRTRRVKNGLFRGLHLVEGKEKDVSGTQERKVEVSKQMWSN